LRVWDLASGQTLRTLEGHTDTVYACAISPDGRTALSASRDGTLRLWDLASGRELAQFYGDAPLRCCAFSRDGRRIVAGDEACAVHFLTVMGPVETAAPSLKATLLGSGETTTPVEMSALEASGGEVIPEPQYRPAGAAADKVRGRRWWPFGRRR
jgi:hypothetical protein